ncbi:MAG: type I-E CRISPR-associated protein Cse1/CasA [Piscinibacter sp.]
MNLLSEPWLPVRRRDGRSDWIAPTQLTDPDLVAFDACRPDFNGALAQFAIGLLQTCTPAADVSAWRRWLQSPPDEVALTEWFSPHQIAFEFDGDGPRFMQDLELRSSDGEPLSVANLLIDAPGENAIRDNSDHFVKRGRVRALCSHCAALALFTLQTNAPSGGAGHRTGLRGGGPLTTLLVATGRPGQPASLWQTLWLNVRAQSTFMSTPPESGMDAPFRTFPWLAPQGALQKGEGNTTPLQVHPAHVFWAMPRRIRLELGSPESGDCDLCGHPSRALISCYVTRNHGLNYEGAWRHPLSPYYAGKEGLLPLHPQPGGLGYRHWLAWVLGVHNDRKHVEPALVVSQFQQRERQSGLAVRLWAFGYDMKNMKPRCWYESTVPLYELGDCSVSEHKALREEVGSWLSGAEFAVGVLRTAVKNAWFGADPRGDLGFVDAAFWNRTEAAFYQRLRERIHALRNGAEITDPLASAESWRLSLRQAALAIFDRDLVGSGAIERQHPARASEARRYLQRSLDGPKLRAALCLPEPVRAKAN